jgi:uncharacterized protein (DUF3084 family)
MNDQTTEQQFFAEYDQMKNDLKHARQEILLLSNQVRDGQTEQQGLAYKADFLTAENARLTASREQYERVAIRAAAMLDGALTALLATLQRMQEEIRDAAFTKVPGSAKPDTIAEEPAPVDVEKIAETFAAGFDGQQTPLPAQPRFGSGPRPN